MESGAVVARVRYSVPIVSFLALCHSVLFLYVILQLTLEDVNNVAITTFTLLPLQLHSRSDYENVKIFQK